MVYKQEEFTPVNDYVIVQPGAVKNITQKLEVPDEAKNKGKGINDTKVLKTIENKIKTMYRAGKILQMSNRETDYNIGDWVVYNEYQAKTLDILARKEPDPKCPVLLKHYDVIAIVNNDKLK